MASASEAPATPPLEREALLAEARLRTGLADIGDTWFYEPMDVMLEATKSEAKLSDIGRVYEAERIVGYLANRLRMVDLLKRHPEIHDEEVKVAAAVVSLSRTGSTKAHRMIGSAPGFTTMAWWEGQFPIPFPGEERGKPIVRRAQAQKLFELWCQTMPDMMSIHPMGLDYPEEEALVIDHSFVGTMIEIFLWVPSYIKWLQTADQHRAYEELKTALKLLQWQETSRRGKSWILKSPSHLSAPEALLDTFPEALIIQTHRDPLRSIPSHCSMNAMIIRMKTNEIDPKQVGSAASTNWAWRTHHLMDLRQRIGDDRFVDIQYQDLLDRPLEEARRVFERLGRTMSPADEAAISAWLANNKREKWSPHIYDLETYGLSEERIKADFARYRERYCS
jgi:hypothetical protein